MQKYPLIALVEEWQKRPIEGRANLNRTDRIFPSRLAMVSQNNRRSARLFGPAMHVIQQDNQQLVLPGFGFERERLQPALPLMLYHLGGGSSMERGRGAPLALRLWVESILAIDLADRAQNWPIVLEIPLRKLLARLYPGPRKPRPNEYWPKLNRAVDILDTTRIPWEDPATGKGGLRRIVNVTSIPRGPGALDDPVRIVVDLSSRLRRRPRGESESGTVWGELGPVVSRSAESGLSLVRAR